MDKFYPKNFVMWRPQLLLFLIFLEAIYDSSGLLKGVAGTYIGGNYNSHCTTDSDCRPEYECHKQRQQCICRNSFESSIYKPGSKLAVFYDKNSKTCVSPVGKLCTLPTRPEEDDGLYKFNCVPYAFCAPKPDKILPQNFGLCQCLANFRENANHLCEPSEEIVIPEEPIFTMAHLVGDERPEESMTSGSKNTDGSPPNKHSSSEPAIPIGWPIREDTNDANADIEVYQSVIDNWEKIKLTNGGGNFGSNTCKLAITVMFVLIFN